MELKIDFHDLDRIALGLLFGKKRGIPQRGFFQLPGTLQSKIFEKVMGIAELG